MRGIALCGFMGCGKTTVANALSLHHNLRHIDTDKYIEDESSMTIAQIFEQYGEDHFRDLEHNAIKSLSKEPDLVLALGGGAVTFERNVKALKDNGYKIVFIDTDLSVIKRRLRNDTTRPLLRTTSVDLLYAKRLATYMSVADAIINCTDESADTIAQMIMEKIKKA